MDFKIEEVIRYIRASYNTVTVRELSEKFGYSESRFSHKFKEETGLSPKEYIVAVKLEYSIEDLTEGGSSVLSTHIRHGYLSEGNFTNIIKKSMIVPPSKLMKGSDTLHEEYLKGGNDYPEPEEYICETRVYITSSEKITGIVFVGLFEKPLPDRPPVIGKVIMDYRKKNYVDFTDVPQGEYYVMATEIASPLQKKNLFVHRTNLRGFIKNKISFPYRGKIFLEIRKPLEKDPPIVLNLPLMLIQVIRDRTMEFRRKPQK